MDFEFDYDGTPAAEANSREFMYPASWRSQPPQAEEGVSAADLAAFADAVADYAAAYETGEDRQRLVREGAELFRRTVGLAA